MRKKRELRDNALYHVTHKINRNEFILENDEVKEIFLQVIREARLKYEFSIKNFCIMSNHVHLLIKPKGNTSLSQLMRWIFGVFAIRFNKYFNLSGHVWADRFKSIIIKSMTHFYNTFRYISKNPVKAGICNDICDFKYSGINFADDPPDFLQLPKKLLQWLLLDLVN